MPADFLAAEDFWFVAIGASGAEGLDDIKDLLSALEPSLNAVVMIVLHRPFESPSNLQEVLGRATRMPVTVAESEEKLEPGRCYIGLPATHLTLLANTFGGLIDDPQKRYRNRTVDLLFKSVAKHGGTRTIGVVLSGSLDDGARGIEAIHQAGGKTMVLLRARRGGKGMPENAISHDGPIDCIGVVALIAQEIRRAVSSS